MTVADHLSLASFFCLNLLQQHWMQNAFSFSTSALLASSCSSCNGDTRQHVILRNGVVFTTLHPPAVPWCLLENHGHLSVSHECWMGLEKWERFINAYLITCKMKTLSIRGEKVLGGESGHSQSHSSSWLKTLPWRGSVRAVPSRVWSL